MFYFTGHTKFLNEIEEIQREVDVLKRQGINKIIALGHSGIRKDIEIADRVQGVDIVVGGHSDTFLYTGKCLSAISITHLIKTFY